MNEWYYKVMGEEIGPVSASELKNLASSNQITPDTFVRQGQTGAWVTADTVTGLFSSVPPRTPANPNIPSPTPRQSPANSIDQSIDADIRNTKTRPPIQQPVNISFPDKMKVVVTGVDIPIMELATLIFRIAIASIPASIMISAVYLLIAIVGGLIWGLVNS